jgi:hypothetical protein
MKATSADARAELVVAGVVRTLAEHALPGEAVLVAQAVTEAVDALAAGASVNEACRVGQLFVAAHPRLSARAAADQAA